ncbi:hypothetical protein JCM19992_31550 [Thermostilla marina]
MHNVRRDLAALFLLLATAFVGVSLASYDPADPPANLVYPPNAEVHNICGRWGARTAHGMLELFGVGAYFTVASLAVVTAVLLLRRSVERPAIRTAGWFAALGGICVLAVIFLPAWSPGSIFGPGGLVGAVLTAFLREQFGTTGTLMLAIGAFTAGMLLACDRHFIKFVRFLVGWPLRGIIAGAGEVARAYGLMRTAEAAADADVEDEVDEAEEIDEEDVCDEESEEEEEEEIEDEEENDAERRVRILAPKAKKSPKEEKPVVAEPPVAKPKLGLRIRKPKKPAREQLLEEIEAAAREKKAVDYELPSLELLSPPEPFRFEEHERDVRRKAKILEKTFADFGFNVRVVEIQTGPVIAQFEVALEAGLRLSKITGLADDLAIALRVPSVRIVAPIPGKNTVGIEVPNGERQIVRLREVMEESSGRHQNMRIPIFLGKDVAGNPLVVDLSTMPHLLIAGRTGTGKSVCLNSIIVSILMTRQPDDVRFLLIDPKMVELSPYKRIPHLMHPVVTDMRKAEALLAWAVEKMEERYALLARAGVRHLSSYNQLGEEELRARMRPESEAEWETIPKHMPYIVIVADEMADLMMTAAKEVETHIIRLAQKSRAVGIHLVLATQKPTVDVITGLIKSNLPARICFEVSSRTDSRVVLDEMGAEKLLGSGDMLFLRPGTSTLVRGQGTYVSDEEINRVIDAVATSEPDFIDELVALNAGDAGPAAGKGFAERDELYPAAVDIVVREGRGSVSLLQRALGIGYGRAARLIDFMAEDGIVGPYNGSQAREVLVTVEQWEAMQNGAAEPQAPAPPSARNRIVLPQPGTAKGNGSSADSKPSEPAPWEEDFAQEETDEEAPEADDEEYDETDDAYEETWEDDEAEEAEDYDDEDWEEEEYDEDDDEYQAESA